MKTKIMKLTRTEKKLLRYRRRNCSEKTKRRIRYIKYKMRKNRYFNDILYEIRMRPTTREERLYDRHEKIEDAYIDSLNIYCPKRISQKHIYTYGVLLGYPKCCAEHFSSTNRVKTPIIWAAMKVIKKAFVPCNTCSQNILNGKYTYLSEILDFEMRKKHQNHIELMTPVEDIKLEYEKWNKPLSEIITLQHNEQRKYRLLRRNGKICGGYIRTK